MDNLPINTPIHVRDLLTRYPDSADTFQDHAIRYILLQLAQDAENARELREMVREVVLSSRDERTKLEQISNRISKVEDIITPLAQRVDKLEQIHTQISKVEDIVSPLTRRVEKLEDPKVSGLEKLVDDLSKKCSELKRVQESIIMRIYIATGVFTGIVALWSILVNTNINIKKEVPDAVPSAMVQKLDK